MQTYIRINDNFIKYTDANGSVLWIPKDEGNTDYQVYLQHTETPADKAAQKAHDDKVLSDKAASDAGDAAADTQKAALLARLGITADEAKLLIG